MTKLNTAPGDGGLSIDVGGFGSFGSLIDRTAKYDPIGSLSEDSTTFLSKIAIRVDGEYFRTFLSDIPDIADPIVTYDPNNSTSTASTFTTKGLNFRLVQSVSDLFQAQGQPRSGSNLSQVYEITNPSSSATSIELVRYFDGDLDFDGTREDTGGLLLKNGREILFETDSGENSAQSSRTFVGITAEGGSTPLSGRYEVGKYNDVRTHITDASYDYNGNPYIQNLNNGIEGDTNGNGFIDQEPYDLALAFNNKFVINPGQTVTYTTNTIFGQGSAAAVVLPNQPPTVANQISDTLATSGTPFSFTVPADAFKDPDTGDTLTYKASLDNGNLPTWLSFNPTTRTFSGTPSISDVNNLKVKVTATDSRQASVSDLFSINVQSTVGMIPAGGKDYTYEFLSKEVAYKTGWTKGAKLKDIYNGTKFQQIAGDYEVSEVFDDSQTTKTGFYALGLKSSTLAPVLVIRGTEPTADKFADILADTNPNGIGFNQYDNNTGHENDPNPLKRNLDPLKWLNAIKNTTGLAPDITGHSLGGALAQYFAANATSTSKVLGDIITFNSPGIAATTVSKFKSGNAKRVEHYIVSGDFVSLGGEKFLPGGYELLDFTDLNSADNHLLPILVPQVNYGSTEDKKQTKPSDVKVIVDSSDNSWLSNNFFTYIDPEYLVVLAAAEKVTQTAPNLQPFQSVPPALLFRGTVEQNRQKIGQNIANITKSIQNFQAGDISIALPKYEFTLSGLKLKAESLSARLNGTQSLQLQGKVSLSDVVSATANDVLV